MACCFRPVLQPFSVEGGPHGIFQRYAHWPTKAERGKAMVWLVTLAILVALVHFELWPIAGIWLCYMIATSLTTPEQ